MMGSVEEVGISMCRRRSDNEKPVCSSEPQRLGDQKSQEPVSLGMRDVADKKD